ncbi:MAG: allantoinase AllB [Firmicutes bacterium]|nr:allantoinase AllB [Bacillota bacterium]
MWDHVIKNGTLVTGGGVRKADICIKDGKIAALIEPGMPAEAAEVTDASGKYVFPGFIDPHVHSREGRFGAKHKEDFGYSSRAAACGGYTTIFEMPNCNPATWNADEVRTLSDEIETRAHCDFGIWGICLGEINNGLLKEMSDAGVIGFKFFWGYAIKPEGYQLVYNYDKSMTDLLPPPDTGEVYKIFRAVAETGKVLAIHAENVDIVKAMTEEAQKRPLRPYEELLESRPVVSELTTIAQAVLLSDELGTRLHILHVPSAGSADLIKLARERGTDVTCETCPHYLVFTDQDAERIGTKMKTLPLIRTREDRRVLWERVKDGTIDFIASDHAPHTREDKAGSFRTALPGISGVETMSAVILDSVNKGFISLPEAAALLSENAAKRYGIYPRKGSLEVGTDADIAIVDMDAEFVFREENMHNKIHMSPYDGMTFKGRAVKTLLRGKTVSENGEPVGGPTGRMVRPE